MIPYTVERRADTGVTNVTLGIWLFLASEVMLFGALFSSYALLRVSAPDWPSGRDVLSLAFAAVNTGVLAMLSALVWRARAKRWRSGRTSLAGASLLAVAFLVVKGIEYSGEIAQGLLPSGSTFLAMYFTLTGLHALHVLGGFAANVWVMAGARRAGEAMTAGRVRALSLYWVFVDLVWLLILGLVYLS